MADPNFRPLAHRMVDFVADYLEDIERYPVLSRASPGALFNALPSDAPVDGMLQPPPHYGNGASKNNINIPALPDAPPAPASGAFFDALAADLHSIIMPGITHWQHPQFYAYFSANTSTPAVLGEILSAGLGVQGMLWATSPACTELEQRMMNWLGKAIGLPSKFLFAEQNISGQTGLSTGGGVIEGTASESTLVALLAARERANRRATPDDFHRPMVVYASSQAHSSVTKAAMIAGIARGPADAAAVRLIPTDDQCRLDPVALSAAIREDISNNKRPIFVAATVGTTGVTAVDPVPAIAHVLSTFPSPIWLHIDAAHSGAACICPEFRWMLDGVEHADSICMNPHKWLLTNFDCGCLWLADPHEATAALSVTPEYLKNAASDSGQVVDYRDWQIPLGRRFRSLKLWFVFRAYGISGLQSYIREHIRLAALFESWVSADERFEVTNQRTVNLVCFRLRSGDTDTATLMNAVNQSGRAYLTHTILPPTAKIASGALVLRLAISGTATTQAHLTQTWDLIRTYAP